MKIHLFLFSIFFITSCCKTEMDNKNNCVEKEIITSQDSSFYIYESGLEEHGYATAIKLNKEWRASARAILFEGKLSVTFDTYIEPVIHPEIAYNTENIHIELLNYQLGCSTLSSTNMNSQSKITYITLDDDVLEDVYSVLDSTKNSFLQIDTLNLNTGRIAGKFMVSFERDKSRKGRKYNPDFVRFFNGEFHCEIVK